MVIAIMSNDSEPQNDSQSQAVKFLLKNWIQFMGLDCYTFTWGSQQQPFHRVNATGV